MSRMSAPDNSEHSLLSVGDEDGPHIERDEHNMADDFNVYSKDWTNSREDEIIIVKTSSEDLHHKFLEVTMCSKEEDNLKITAKEEDSERKSFDATEEDSSKSNEAQVCLTLG